MIVEDYKNNKDSQIKLVKKKMKRYYEEIKNRNEELEEELEIKNEIIEELKEELNRKENNHSDIETQTTHNFDEEIKKLTKDKEDLKFMNEEFQKCLKKNRDD